MNLREQYFQALKESQQKQMVSKSVSDVSPVRPGRIGPYVYAVRNNSGEIIGFGQGEPLSKSEIDSLKTEIAKSATLEPDNSNSIFDDLFEFRPSDEPQTVQVQKSVESDDDTLLQSLFPRWLRSN